MVQIIPAVLATTPEKYKEDIEKLNKSESLKEDGWVHIDFMDNKFVPNQSIDVSVASEIQTNLKKEAHLMVENPLEWISKCQVASFQRVIFHFESKDNPQDVIKLIKESGMEAGIALNPETDTEVIKDLENLDLVLIMGVKPGFQGQPFEENTYDRIEKAAEINENISVDGAVKDENALKLMQSGAKILVSGSFILNGNIDEQIEKISEAVQG